MYIQGTIFDAASVSDLSRDQRNLPPALLFNNYGLRDKEVVPAQLQGLVIIYRSLVPSM